MSFEEPKWKNELKMNSGPKFFLEVKEYKGKDSPQMTIRSQFAKQDRFGGTRIWIPLNKEDIDSLIASLMDLSKYAE